MKTYSTITLQIDDDIALLTLNRPDKLNALNAQMRAEITDACGFAGPHSRVLVLTSSGRAFCAGQEI